MKGGRRWIVGCIVGVGFYLGATVEGRAQHCPGNCCPTDCSGSVQCFPQGSLSFADRVIRYAHTCDPLNSDFDDPADALGEPNYTRASDGTFPYCFNSGINAVALGDGGLIELEFVNNLLTNSGNSTADLYVFEVGTGDEPTFVELRPRDQATLQFLQTGGVRHDTDGDGFFEFGLIGGGTGSLDIDFGLGAPPGSLKFDAVQLVDDPSDGNCTSANDSPGADIDAIGAIQSAPVTAVVSRSWGAVKILHR